MLVWIDVRGGFKGCQSGIFISNQPSSGIMVSKSVAGVYPSGVCMLFPWLYEFVWVFHFYKICKMYLNIRHMGS